MVTMENGNVQPIPFGYRDQNRGLKLQLFVQKPKQEELSIEAMEL